VRANQRTAGGRVLVRRGSPRDFGSRSVGLKWSSGARRPPLDRPSATSTPGADEGKLPTRTWVEITCRQLQPSKRPFAISETAGCHMPPGHRSRPSERDRVLTAVDFVDPVDAQVRPHTPAYSRERRVAEPDGWAAAVVPRGRWGADRSALRGSRASTAGAVGRPR
jgi:hypothetical protein